MKRYTLLFLHSKFGLARDDPAMPVNRPRCRPRAAIPFEFP